MNPDDLVPATGMQRLMEDLGITLQEEHGECVEVDAWVPIIHPMTGERVNIRAPYHDHIILDEQRQELEAMMEGEAHNTPDDYYDGKDE